MRPGGTLTSIKADSYEHHLRADYKRYYVHFKRLRIAPGTKMLVFARMEFEHPVRFLGVDITGWRYKGGCTTATS